MFSLRGLTHVCFSFSQKCVLCEGPRIRMHGAPVQCAKGKCPRAFHVSCARTSTSGTLYHFIGELEKEVVLQDANTTVSTIKKDQVEVFCTAHNDMAKKDRKKKSDEERRALLVPGGRIRVRAATGVYEVSLLRVMDEEGAIEVLWSAG